MRMQQSAASVGTSGGSFFPGALAEDDEDVQWAMSTASALWGSGDRPGALVWLRRAAISASNAGRASRARDLFAAARELEGSGTRPAAGSSAPETRRTATQRFFARPVLPPPPSSRPEPALAGGGDPERTKPLDRRALGLRDPEEPFDAAFGATEVGPETTLALGSDDSEPSTSVRESLAQPLAPFPEAADGVATAPRCIRAERPRTLQSWARVAVARSPWGDLTVMPLELDAPAPAGSVVAALVALCSQDAEQLERFLAELEQSGSRSSDTFAGEVAELLDDLGHATSSRRAV